MIYFVVGTKAQLIKVAPLMRRLKEIGEDYIYISTGQHKETVDEIISNFDIRGPDVILYDGKDIVSIFSMFFWAINIFLKSVFKRKEIFINKTNEDILLVHGDTLSTLVGALIGKINGLKVGHVESGLRSFDLFNPFPEELTRIFVFKLSNVMYCPDEKSLGNVSKYRARKVLTNGNTLRDSISIIQSKSSDGSGLELGKKYAVVSIHRFENISNKNAIEKVIGLVEHISKSMNLIFILHKPTRKKLIEFGLYDRLDKNPNIELRPRYDYAKFVSLILGSEFVVSDGGGNQEECSYIGKPIILLRKATERDEGLGVNCVLSKYNSKIIDDFVLNYKKYAVANIIDGGMKSPSIVIVDDLKKYYG